MGEERYKQIGKEMAKDLPPGFYRCKQLEMTVGAANEKIVAMAYLVAASAGQPEVYFVKLERNDQFRAKVINTRHFLDRDSANAAVKRGLVGIGVLSDNHYRSYDVKDGATTFYAVAFKVAQNPEIKSLYFTTAKERNDYITIELKGWIEKKAGSDTLSLEEVKARIGKEAYDRIEKIRLGLHPFTYRTEDIVSTDKKTTFYVLLLGKPMPAFCVAPEQSSPLFFADVESRAKAIKESNRYDAKVLDDKIFGKKGIIARKELYKYATQDFRYLNAHFEIDGKNIYVIIYSQTVEGKKRFYYVQFASAELRQSFLEERKEYQAVVLPERQPYTADELKQLIDEQAINDLVLKSKGLKEEQYLTTELTSNDKKVTLYSLVLGGANKQPIFFKNSEARDEAITTLAVGKYSFMELIEKVRGATGVVVLKELAKFAKQDYMYSKEKFTIDGKQIFALVYPVAGEFFVAPFTSEEARTQFLSKHAEYKEIVFPNSVMDDKEQISPIEAAKFITPKHLEAIKAHSGYFSQKEYFTFDIPRTDHTKETVVYSLAYKEPGSKAGEEKVLHFKSLVARDAFIQKQLKEYSDYGAQFCAVYGVPDGMLGEQGAIKTYGLRERLKANELFKFDFVSSGKTCFAWVTRHEASFPWSYSIAYDASKREQNIKNLATFVDRTEYVNECVAKSENHFP